MNPMRILAVLSCLLTGGIAVAGQQADYGVTVNLVNRTAYASMAGARHSPDPHQHLKCSISASIYSISGFCSVRDAQGTQYYCSTSNQYLLEAIKAIKDTSFVFFAWDANGNCTLIDVDNASFYGPKR